MKNNLTIAVYSLFLIITILACTTKEEVTENTGITSLTISASFSGVTLAEGQNITFSAVGSDEIDYTLESTFLVNGAEIPGAEYTFNALGNYFIEATLDGVISNSISFEVVTPQQLDVVLESAKILRNQVSTFALQDAAGNDFTSTATFYVDGVSLLGNTYSSEAEGSHEVYATYEFGGAMLTSPEITLEVFIPKKKILFEDYTGTWCGYCSHMLERIEDMKASTENVAVVSIHLGSNDPFTFPQVQTLIDYFEVIFVPTGYSNRAAFFGFLDPFEWALFGLDEEINTTIALDSNLDGDLLTVDVKVVSEEGMTGKNVVVLLLEDGLIHSQANNGNNDPDSPYYQMGNPIPNFVHDEVLRAALTDVFGDPIPVTPALDTYKKTISYTVPSGYDLSSLSLVAFVTDADNKAITTQYADVGVSKDFE